MLLLSDQPIRHFKIIQITFRSLTLFRRQSHWVLYINRIDSYYQGQQGLNSFVKDAAELHILACYYTQVWFWKRLKYMCLCHYNTDKIWRFSTIALFCFSFHYLQLSIKCLIPNRSWSLTCLWDSLMFGDIISKKLFKNNMVNAGNGNMGMFWWQCTFCLSIYTHNPANTHSPIVAFGLVLSPSMLGPSSGSGSHGQEMFMCKSNDNDVVKFMCYGG